MLTLLLVLLTGNLRCALGIPLDMDAPLLQNSKQVYEVIHNGKVKGVVRTFRDADSSVLNFRIESEVTINLVFSFTMKLKEEAIFKNGILAFSSIYRKINGREKINQQLHSAGQSYTLTGISKEFTPAFPVRSCIISLYYDEPRNMNTVYSDSFRKNVPVTFVGGGRYRIDLPDGNHNFYSYKNGICTLVEVDHSLFRLYFKLIQPKNP